MGKATIKAETRDEILQKVRNGTSVRDAAERYGVSTKTIYKWLNQKADGGKSEILELSRLKRENEALFQILGRMTYQRNLQERGKKS